MIMTNQEGGSDDRESSGLSHRQTLFVEYFLGDARGNATEAARMAGYSGTNDVLKVQGHRLLGNPRIAARVTARVGEAAVTADRVIAELASIAFAPRDEYVEVKYGRGGVVIDARLVLADKVRALELLGKYFKLFTDRVEVQTEEVCRVLEYVPPVGYGVEKSP